jgi:lipopolysaccharide transport system permease protein
MSVPYVVFAVVGMAFWQLFAAGLTSCTQSLVAGGALLTKVNFPRESLVFAAYGVAAVPFVVQLVLGLGLMIAYRVPFTWAALAAIPACLPLVLLTMGLGLLTSLLHGLARDVGAVMPAVVSFLLFFTPILYARPTSGIASTMATYNPLYYLTGVPRDLLLFGSSDYMLGYWVSAAGSIIVVVVAWQIFHLAECRLVERI